MLTRDQSRYLDRYAIEELGVPGIVLMENAGRGMAELLLALGAKGPVLVCCGKGNNGGDGFVIARHLDNHGIAVRVRLFARPEELTGDAAVNYHVLVRGGLFITATPHADEANLRADLEVSEWVVDALFGVGVRGPVRAPFDRVIEVINAAPARVKVLAVDLPSGLDCDTGKPLGPTVRADHTATVAALKLGFQAPEARPWIGKVHLIDMGAPHRGLGLAPVSRNVGPQA